MSVQVASSVPNTRGNIQGNVETAGRSHAYDGVDKLRISAPQSLIDTDFEYGVQPTKWETIQMQNNRQSMYYDAQVPIPIIAATGITSAGAATRSLITVFTTASNLAVAQPVYVQDALNVFLNGWWYIETFTPGVSFQFYASGSVPTGVNYFNPANTYAYAGQFYSNGAVRLAASAFAFSGTTITVTTVAPHGMSAGSQIYVTGLTGGTPAPNGAFVLTSATANNIFQYTAISAPTVGITNTVGNTNVFSRPAGNVIARPFDGGVSFTAGANVPNAQIIRQTRRYFRYQSGKAIQFSTGSSMAPVIQVATMTASGTTITTSTTAAHNLAVGTVIKVLNAVQVEYNGTFTVLTTPTLNTMTYRAITAPLVLTATTLTQFRLNPVNWFGSVNRIGIFDLQNGLFFEYDGRTLFCVRRSSTTQLQGTVQVTQGSGQVIGLNTAFATQLNTRDYIVIRGQSYRVLNIESDTSLFVTPEYRGATYVGSAAGGFTVSRTIDTRIPQSQWYDKCDGTGQSGYNLDITKMQMWFIDYSWYGAGVARFGFRAKEGAITYVHSFVANNIEFEAYMRSGNLPAHYEVDGLLPDTQITATFDNTQPIGSSLQVLSTEGFPPSGSIRVSQAGATGTCEVMTYSLSTPTTFVISGRAQAGASLTNQSFTFSSTAVTSVEYVSPDTAVALSHWGSSVIMDGRFDDDKSLIFNFGSFANIAIPANATVPIVALRIAPSVDSGQTGTFGNKEIVNHMQLQPVSLGLVTSGPFLIQLTLNAFTTGFSGSFIAPTIGTQVTSSLSQVALNTNTTATITGGESAAAAFTNSGGETSLDLSQVRDLGNSILGGGLVNTVPNTRANVFPDGPDILYIAATNTTGGALNLLARLSWKESQA